MFRDSWRSFRCTRSIVRISRVSRACGGSASIVFFFRCVRDFSSGVFFSGRFLNLEF